MEPLFLYQRWVRKTLKDYVTSTSPSKLKGRIISMSPHQYAAALMQAYFGKASLGWISEITGIPLEYIQNWRKKLEFLLVMDWSKSIFSETFQQTLILNDYSVAQYHEISAEFSILEESLRVAVRVQLYIRFKTLAEKLISSNKHGLKLEMHDLNLFRRLFLFFLALEHHWPSAARNPIQEKFLPFAKEVAWPLLGQEDWVESELGSAQHNYPLSQLRLLLVDQLRETFRDIGILDQGREKATQA